jgi:hypothetical protein
MTCTCCGGAMLPEWGTRFKQCPECREKGNEYAKRRYSTAKGRKERKLAMRRYRAKNLEKIRAYERMVYAERDASKVCVECENPRAPEGGKRCVHHRDLHRKLSREAWHRARKGEKPQKRQAKRGRPAKPKTDITPLFTPAQTSTPIADYRNGDIEFATAVRRFIELCNGVSAMDIADEFGLEPGSAERNNMDVALSRFSRTGKVRFEQTSDGRIYYPLRQNRRAA